MNKVTLITNAIWMSVILLGTLSTQSMEKIWYTSFPEWGTTEYEEEQAKREYNNYVKKTSHQAKKYNQLNPLAILPKGIFNNVLSYCHSPYQNPIRALEKSIQYFLALKTTCKRFNKLLTFKTIGNLCKNYTPKTKNNTFKELIEDMHDVHYKIKRLPALILICAGADANIKTRKGPLLEDAVYKEDKQLTATLLNHHANPNIHVRGLVPIIFFVKKVKIAQIFIDNNVDLHATDYDSGENVLWQTLQDKYSYKLMKFYLKNNADTSILNYWNKSCILHALAEESLLHYGAHDIKRFLKKGELLLNAIPKKMINTVDRREKTPLDIALASLERAKKWDYRAPEAFEKLIVMFRKHGGKTAQELQEDIDVNAIYACGETALMRATKRADITRAAQLLALGADANIRDMLGFKALDYAFSNDMIQLLIPYTTEDTRPNCIICMDKKDDIVEVPCIGRHDECMCLECYGTLLMTSDNCPLCRRILKT